MLLTTPLLAAVVIASAFWGGVLLARRLREWGDGRPMLDEGGRAPALPAATPDAAHGGGVKRIRARVAERIHAELASDGLTGQQSREAEELTVDRIRPKDVVTVESGVASHDGDYLVDGFVRMEEGGITRIVVAMADGQRRRWLVADVGAQRWLVVDPVVDHSFSDEPPRTIRRHGVPFLLEHRTQVAAAASGRHGRPDGSRVGVYHYRGPGYSALWLERWGREILMAEGDSVARQDVSFLPGS
ncbi:MAG: DUF4178 domain-containing protein [Nannocystaceae bacterium]